MEGISKGKGGQGRMLGMEGVEERMWETAEGRGEKAVRWGIEE